MAVTLAQAKDLTQDMVQKGVIQTFIDASPVLDRLPLMEIEGSGYRYSRENTLPGVAFRAVNAGYTESTGAVVNATEALVILGGDADVDKFLQQTMSNLNDQRSVQSALKAKALAFKFTETFFEGDDSVDTESFDGLRTRLTGAQVVAAGTNGAAVTLDMLDDLIDRVLGGPDVLYANKWLIRKINALVRATGGTVPEPIESYGKRVYSYAGIPLIDAGPDATGAADIIAFDETQGSSSITASIYAVKYGEQEFVSGLTNGGVMVDDLGELETKPVFRTRIEFYCGMAIFNGKAAARLKGVLQS